MHFSQPALTDLIHKSGSVTLTKLIEGKFSVNVENITACV